MNSTIKYNNYIQKSLLFSLIAFSFSSCMTTQSMTNKERDGIYYNPAKDAVYADKHYKKARENNVTTEDENIVRLGGKYFNKDLDAPKSFEDEVYRNDPVNTVIQPTNKDYIQWGNYQGTDITYNNYASYGMYPPIYPNYYNNFNLGLSFGFGSGFYSSFYPRGFYPYGYYNPYRFYGFHNPFFYDYYDRFYFPYYGYGYRNHYYGNPYYRNPYYGYGPIYRNVAPVTRGKGMQSNVNNNVINNRSTSRSIIRRDGSTNTLSSQRSYRKDNYNNTSIRKRSLNEIRSSNPYYDRSNTYNRNSIRNSRNNNNVIYRRSNTNNNNSRSRSSNWSQSSPSRSVQSSTPARSSSSTTRSSSSNGSRIRR